MAKAEVLVYDVVEMILLRLPLKSILRFRCVSIEWDRIISDKEFERKHYDIARCRKRLIVLSSSYEMKSLDLQVEPWTFRKLTFPVLKPRKWESHDQLTLLGSSRGLLCLSLYPHKNFCLWNPSTGFFRKFRDPDFSGYFGEDEEDEVDFCVYHYGFGCVSAADDYKLFVGFRNGSDFEEFFTFSLKNQSWSSDISDAPHWIDLIEQRQGVLSNEKLHWLTDFGRYGSLEEEDCILAFDLGNQMFVELSLPNFDDNDDHLEYANLLGVSSDGRLYLSHHLKGFSTMNSASIWYMNEHGVVDSWTKLFDLKISPEPLEPITCLGPIFVVEKRVDYYGNTFTEIKYQPQPQPQPHLDLLKHERLLDMVVSAETLVRLDGVDEDEAAWAESGDGSDDQSSDDFDEDKAGMAESGDESDDRSSDDSDEEEAIWESGDESDDQSSDDGSFCYSV